MSIILKILKMLRILRILRIRSTPIILYTILAIFIIPNEYSHVYRYREYRVYF